jgi:hypothetical protein
VHWVVRFRSLASATQRSAMGSSIHCCCVLLALQAEFGAANVAVDLAVHKILGVDLYGGTLKLAVWLRLNWFDPRLTWDAKEWNVSRVWFMNPQQGDTEIWEVSLSGHCAPPPPPTYTPLGGGGAGGLPLPKVCLTLTIENRIIIIHEKTMQT